MVALSFIQNILQQCGKQALLLIEDMGPLLPDEIRAVKMPQACITRDVRLPVAFDLLRLHVQNNGGFCESVPRHEDERVCMLAYGFSKNELTKTRLAFRQSICMTSPEEIHTIISEYIQPSELSSGDNLAHGEAGLSPPTAKESSGNRSENGIQAILRLSQGDMDCLLEMRSALQQLHVDSRVDSRTCRRNIQHQLHRVRDY